MDRKHRSAAIRVAVAAPFPEIVRVHEGTAEYADEIEVCAMISSADAVLEQARLLQPDVLLLSDGLGATPSDTLARLGAVAPSTRLVMLVAEAGGDTPVIADAVLRLDASAAEMRAAIVAVTGGQLAQRAAPAAHSRVPTESASQAQAAEPEPGGEEAGAHGHARTVLVFSGKGGVGKSVVATNLATALALRGARVALVDLNLQYGDVGVLLHLESHPITIDAITQQGDAVDAAALEDALATSEHGVRVLLAPSSPESSDLVSAAGLEAILGQLSRTHDVVVVDSPPHLEERVVGVMEVADQILLVSSFGITSVKDAKVTLRLLQSLGIPPDRVALVVNQTRPRLTFSAEEIERTLRFPILSTLPFEPRMEETIESGRPMVVSEPRSGFSRQMALIVDHVGRAQAVSAAPNVRHQAARWRLRFGR
ncbi:MAG: P-loop NTPase [Candidatus Dormibacteraeota bacterium]|uniref:P-loop NTPase n=1 Tax=Candidatus Aeolococcus gillhamiae TaxID=3127015 RepID=A0A934K494_9BACT|nr:P-loop NTPase [Candidatus Dormibacteraeota bacterium]